MLGIGETRKKHAPASSSSTHSPPNDKKIHGHRHRGFQVPQDNKTKFYQTSNLLGSGVGLLLSPPQKRCRKTIQTSEGWSSALQTEHMIFSHGEHPQVANQSVPVNIGGICLSCKRKCSCEVQWNQTSWRRPRNSQRRRPMTIIARKRSAASEQHPIPGQQSTKTTGRAPPFSVRMERVRVRDPTLLCVAISVTYPPLTTTRGLHPGVQHGIPGQECPHLERLKTVLDIAF